MSFECITSRINDRPTLSLEELVHQTIVSMIPSKTKKEDSGLFQFALARSNVKMDVFYVNFIRIYLLIFKNRREIW